MQLLFYTLPSLLFIIAFYLWYTRHELQHLLKLNTTKGIISLAFMYGSLSILGFMLLLLSLINYFYIWLVIAAGISILPTYLIYKTFK